jgi:hypothetical protein
MAVARLACRAAAVAPLALAAPVPGVALTAAAVAACVSRRADRQRDHERGSEEHDAGDDAARAEIEVGSQPRRHEESPMIWPGALPASWP